MGEESTDACQQSEDIGPSCATVCARRMMTCNPCAMKAATTSFSALTWALTQAGNSVMTGLCASNTAVKNGFPPTKEGQLAFVSSPQAAQPVVPTNNRPGWFGALCGTLPEDNFRLFFCRAPNFDLVAQQRGYTDACQVPAWTREFEKTGNTLSVSATWGALCFCERRLQR